MHHNDYGEAFFPRQRALCHPAAERVYLRSHRKLIIFFQRQFSEKYRQQNEIFVGHKS